MQGYSEMWAILARESQMLNQVPLDEDALYSILETQRENVALMYQLRPISPKEDVKQIDDLIRVLRENIGRVHAMLL